MWVLFELPDQDWSSALGFQFLEEYIFGFYFLNGNKKYSEAIWHDY